MTARHYARMAKRDGDDGGPLVFVASTAGVKRDGLNIDQSRWRLANFEANPVLLWSHDYSRPPIGRARVWVEDGELLAEAAFDAGDPFAVDIERKYRAGILHSVSVGWQDVTEDGAPARRDAKPADVWHDLMDLSAVSVPGDPAATLSESRDAMRRTAAELLAAAGDCDVDDADGAVDVVTGVPAGARASEPTWDDTAAAMVAVFDPAGDDDDKARRRSYNALLPRYRRAGKTPPEFMGADDLRALGLEEWRGLWLEGELMTTRVGAVLNARNKERLQAARDAIGEVLASATEAGDGERAGARGARATMDEMMAEMLAMLADIKAMLAGDDATAEGAADGEEEARATDDDTNDAGGLDPATADTLRAILAGMER